MIGTLLDVNERIIVSLQMYDNVSVHVCPPAFNQGLKDVSPLFQMLKTAEHDSDEEGDAAAKMAALSVQPPPVSEISKLQGKQRAAIERASSRSSLNVNSGGVSRPAGGRNVHPDLSGLTWGEKR